MISVVIPTYNEAENIELMIKAISEALSGKEFEILVVDDNSKDGTAEKAEKTGVRVIVRKDEKGLSSAILRGFKEAKGEIVGVIDSDFQHPPEAIPRLVEPIENGEAEMTVGSRLVKGGGIEGWAWHRKLISWGARLLARPITSVKDCMSGLFFLRKEVIQDVELNLIGYKLGLEIVVKGKYNKIKEVPYVFRSRERGVSKLGWKVQAAYLMHLASLYKYKLKKVFFNEDNFE